MLAGIEQGDGFAGDRIECGRVVGFVVVAGRACQTQIFFSCDSALRFRDNMVHLKRRADNAFRRLAVAAPMRKVIGDALAQN